MLELKFEGILLTVKDLNRAQDFYENILNQTPLYDYEGQMITYESGISLAPESAYRSWFKDGMSPNFKIHHKSNSSQLYFEVEDLDSYRLELTSKIVVDWIHKPITSSYGARTMRFYDYDGHIIEVAESIKVVATRLLSQGMTVEEIAVQFGDSVEVIEELLDYHNLKK